MDATATKLFFIHDSHTDHHCGCVLAWKKVHGHRLPLSLTHVSVTMTHSFVPQATALPRTFSSTSGSGQCTKSSAGKVCEWGRTRGKGWSCPSMPQRSMVQQVSKMWRFETMDTGQRKGVSSVL